VDWLDQLPGIVTGKLTEYGQLADGFFASLETAIDEKIDTIVMPGLKQQTFGSPAPSAPPAAFDVEKFLSGVQHNWLLDKIESFFAGDTPTQVNTDLQAALDQLAVAMQDGVQVVTDIGDLLWQGLQEPFASSDSAQQARLAEFVGLLKQAVHDLLAFADAIVQALIDLKRSGRKVVLVTGRELPDLSRCFSRLDLFDRPADRRRVGDVENRRMRLRAQAFELRHHSVNLGRVPPIDHDRRPRAGEALGKRQSNPRRRTRDQRDGCGNCEQALDE